MLKYSFLETGHVFLIIDDEKITIKSSDSRCAPLKELLVKNPTKEEVWKVVDPLRFVGTKHLNKEDGSVFINEVKIPVQLEKIFKENYSNPLQNKRLYNAILTEINNKRNDLQKLLLNGNYYLKNKLIIADENGTIVFVDRYSASYHQDLFFSTQSLPEILQRQFLDKHSGDLSSLLLEYNFDAKFIPKFLNYIIKNKKTDKFPWIIIYMYNILSDVVDKQNLHKFILSKELEYFNRYESNWQTYYLQTPNMINLKEFLSKKLKWSDISIFKELDENNLFFSQLNNIVTTYNDLDQTYPLFVEHFNLEKWRKMGGLQVLQNNLYHFQQKYKPNYPLNQQVHWPEIKKNKKWIIEGYNIKVAQTSHDLIQWSEFMSNCIHGYDKRAAKGESLLLAVCDAKGKMWINCQFIKNESGQRYLNQFNSFGNGHTYPDELNKVKEELILTVVIQPIINKLKATQEYIPPGKEVAVLADDVYKIKKLQEFLIDRKYSEFECVKKLNLKNIFNEKKGQKQFAFLKKM